jgi:GPH family glycoside/pentoside/hexuronide:cation symporter
MSYLLVWGGYEATAAVQTSKALFAIRFGFAGASIIATAICIFVMLFYDLDKKYPQIKADLDAKRRVNERK